MDDKRQLDGWTVGRLYSMGSEEKEEEQGFDSPVPLGYFVGYRLGGDVFGGGSDGTSDCLCLWGDLGDLANDLVGLASLTVLANILRLFDKDSPMGFEFVLAPAETVLSFLTALLDTFTEVEVPAAGAEITPAIAPIGAFGRTEDNADRRLSAGGGHPEFIDGVGFELLTGDDLVLLPEREQCLVVLAQVRVVVFHCFSPFLCWGLFLLLLVSIHLQMLFASRHQRLLL